MHGFTDEKVTFSCAVSIGTFVYRSNRATTAPMNRAIALVAITACSSGGNDAPDASTHDASHIDSPQFHDAPTNIDAPHTAANTTVFTIVFENHDYAEIVGSSNAPYINSLIASGGLATHYADTGHPSLPNYLNMISGDNQYIGLFDVGPNFIWFPAANPNLGTQLETANIKWRSYQESMGTPCLLTDNGNFATKHDPFLYFTDQQMGASGLCANTNVDFSAFASDLATNTYRYMWITPNLIDDGHDPATDPVAGLAQSDHWLSTVVPTILASDAYKAGGVLFITWDESEGRNGDDPDKIPMIVVSMRVKTPGMTSATAYTHSSYLATVEDMLGLPRLATVTSEPNLLGFLNT